MSRRVQLTTFSAMLVIPFLYFALNYDHQHSVSKPLRRRLLDELRERVDLSEDEERAFHIAHTVPEHAMRHHSAAYPRHLHDYIMAELSMGNEDKLSAQFPAWDFKSAALAFEDKLAPIEGVRRRMQGTPAPTDAAPTAPPTHPLSYYSSRLDAEGNTSYIAVNFHNDISWSTAREFCNQTMLADMAYVDKQLGDDREQTKALSNACAGLQNASNPEVNCWIGMKYMLYDENGYEAMNWVLGYDGEENYYAKPDESAGTGPGARPDSWPKPWHGTIPDPSWFTNENAEKLCGVAVHDISYVHSQVTYTHGWTAYDCHTPSIQDQPVTAVVCMQKDFRGFDA